MAVDTRESVSFQDEEMREVAEHAQRIEANVASVIIGKDDVIRACVVALLAGGHIVIEDYPGVGKTLLAKALARSVACRFARVQFTPDLLPSDVTGVGVFNQKTGEFEFRAGPIFANIVLADEINRSSPKTQASLLECMEERQATVDNTTHDIPAPFMVIATQNPIEYEGTYPLPEAQLDRFMMRVSLGYPDATAEEAILHEQTSRDPYGQLSAVLDAAQVLAMQRAVERVRVVPALHRYVVAILTATRTTPRHLPGRQPPRRHRPDPRRQGPRAVARPRLRGAAGPQGSLGPCPRASPHPLVRRQGPRTHGRSGDRQAAGGDPGTGSLTSSGPPAGASLSCSWPPPRTSPRASSARGSSTCWRSPFWPRCSYRGCSCSPPDAGSPRRARSTRASPPPASLSPSGFACATTRSCPGCRSRCPMPQAT